LYDLTDFTAESEEMLNQGTMIAMKALSVLKKKVFFFLNKILPALVWGFFVLFFKRNMTVKQTVPP